MSFLISTLLIFSPIFRKARKTKQTLILKKLNYSEKKIHEWLGENCFSRYKIH